MAHHRSVFDSHQETVDEALEAIDYILQKKCTSPPPTEQVPPPAYYDPDCSVYPTVSTIVKMSPLRYATLHSGTGRFQEPRHLVDIVYNTDAGPRQTVATRAATAGNVITTFKSTAPRLPRQQLPPGDYSAVYNPDAGAKETLATHIASSSAGLVPLDADATDRFSNPQLGCTTPRVGPGAYTADVIHTVHPADRRAAAFQEYKRQRTTAARKAKLTADRQAMLSRLGPGAYSAPELPRAQGVVPISTVPRWPNRRASNTHALSNTPTVLERDAKTWLQKNITIGGSSQRPPMENTAVIDLTINLNLDCGPKASLAKAVETSPQKYSAALRSKEIRLASLTAPPKLFPKTDKLANDLGPGAYDSHTVKDRLISRTESRRPGLQTISISPARMDVRLMGHNFETLHPRTNPRKGSIAVTRPASTDARARRQERYEAEGGW